LSGEVESQNMRFIPAEEASRSNSTAAAAPQSCICECASCIITYMIPKPTVKGKGRKAF